MKENSMERRIALLRRASSLLLVATLAACTQAVPAPVDTALAMSASPATVSSRNAADISAPRITVHRDAHCGCCHLWIDHLRAQGFEVDDRSEPDMSPVKQRLGIPPDHASCHTAEVGGYVVEGHVPAADIHRLLREKPPIHGLVLPGMPLGSPGMDVDGIDAPPYTVLALGHDGKKAPYAEHRP
jgi:hypothetical protein